MSHRRLASSNEATTWASYPIAANVARLTQSGLGFVFNGDGLVGIDLDHCVQDGQIAPFAMEVVYRLWSYTEMSPSGTGLHVFCRGRLPRAGRKAHVDSSAIEAYTSGRYFTVTGRGLPWTPDEPQDAGDGLEWLVDTYFPSPTIAESATNGEGTNAPDDAILEAARAASNGDGFIELYDLGDLSRFNGDHSRADASLMARLAFYTGRNSEQMERLFSASALGQREKWQYRQDYRERTIERACQQAAVVYSGDHSGNNWLEGVL
jgi:primase-polymerase (primpol)-like protein